MVGLWWTFGLLCYDSLLSCFRCHRDDREYWQWWCFEGGTHLSVWAEQAKRWDKHGRMWREWRREWKYMHVTSWNSGTGYAGGIGRSGGLPSNLCDKCHLDLDFYLVKRHWHHRAFMTTLWRYARGPSRTIADFWVKAVADAYFRLGNVTRWLPRGVAHECDWHFFQIFESFEMLPWLNRVWGRSMQ